MTFKVKTMDTSKVEKGTNKGIPKEYFTKAENVGRKIGKTGEEVLKMFEERLAGVPKDAKMYENAWKKLILDLADSFGTMNSNATPYYIYLMYDEGIKDSLEVWKRIAVHKGMVDENGNPLDCREKVFGKPNDNYGLPFGEPEYERNLYCIVSKDKDFDKIQVGKLRATGVNCNFTIEQSEFYTVRLTEAHSKEMPAWNIVGASKFEKHVPAITLQEIANKITTTKIADLPAIAEMYPKDWQQPLTAIRGVVSRIGNEYSGKDFRIIDVIDSDTFNQISMYTPSKLPISFLKGADVVAVGKVFKGKNSGIMLRCLGIIPNL
jgi:hypothetical protein